jgi:hypothetical protein
MIGLEEAAEEMRLLIEMQAVCPHITDEMLAVMFNKHIDTLRMIIRSDIFQGRVRQRREYWEAKQKEHWETTRKEEIVRLDTGLPPEMWP